MEEIAKRDHFRNLIGRLAKAAEYNLVKAAQIPKSVCRGNDFFHRRIAVFQPQIVAIVAGTLVSYAKIAGVGAFVGEVDIQIAVQGIDVGILAVFLALILLFLLFGLIALLLIAVLSVVLLLGLRLFGLLFLGLLLIILLRLRVFFLPIFLLIPFRLVAVLVVLGLLRSLRGLRLLGTVFAVLVVALIALAASVTTALSAAARIALLRVKLFGFVLNFVHNIRLI